MKEVEIVGVTKPREPQWPCRKTRLSFPACVIGKHSVWPPLTVFNETVEDHTQQHKEALTDEHISSLVCWRDVGGE